MVKMCGSTDTRWLLAYRPTMAPAPATPTHDRHDESTEISNSSTPPTTPNGNSPLQPETRHEDVENKSKSSTVSEEEATHDKPNHTLFLIPPEVRENIYRFVLSSSTGILYPSRDVSNPDRQRVKWSEFAITGYKRSSGDFDELGLLRVCRKIYEEAR